MILVSDNKKICIIGAGGFGQEVLCLIMDIYANTHLKAEEFTCFMVDDEYYESPVIRGIPVIRKSQFDPMQFHVVVAIGNPVAREKMVNSLPLSTTYASLIHPTAQIGQWVKVKEGAIITAGAILTCNISIGKHAHINLHTTIGHDCEIGDFFTTAPSVNISGNCLFGDRVYFGTNSAIREKTKVCGDVVVGMGAMIVKNIDEPGIYVGNPAKKLVR